MNEHILYQVALYSMRLLNWNEITGIYQTDMKIISRERQNIDRSYHRSWWELRAPGGWAAAWRWAWMQSRDVWSRPPRAEQASQGGESWPLRADWWCRPPPKHPWMEKKGSRWRKQKQKYGLLLLSTTKIRIYMEILSLPFFFFLFPFSLLLLFLSSSSSLKTKFRDVFCLFKGYKTL